MNATQDQEFLQAINETPGDVVLRNVYADWLEENNRLEESLRQRRIAVGWKLMGDFKPHNLCMSEDSLFSVWRHPKGVNHKPYGCAVSEDIWELVDLPVPELYPTAKDGSTELEVTEAVAEACAKIKEKEMRDE